MEIGKLNQRITVLENRTVVDEIGNHTTKWEEAFSCWANVTVKSSSESDATGVTKEVQTLQFLIRQRQTETISTTKNRIAFQGVIYDMISMTPDFVRKDYLKISATARKGSYQDGLY